MDLSDPRWQATADALGMPLEDLLTAMSYETGGTLNPRQKGPTTKWGQHEGLIQFGEPQAAKYGVDFSSEEAAWDTQLGPDGAVVQYMLDHGYKPGEHGFMDFYSTINAGAPGRYSASDTAAGGAPGTVADKVNSQMGGHRANAQKWLSGAGLPTSRAGIGDGSSLQERSRKSSASLDMGTPVPDDAGLEYDRRKRRVGAGMDMASLGLQMLNGGYF